MPKRNPVSRIGYRAGLAVAVFIVMAVVTGRDWLAGILALSAFLIQGAQEYEDSNPGKSVFGNQEDET